jgi:hypothetical protein
LRESSKSLIFALAMKRAMMKHFAWGVLLVSIVTSGLQAQFHAKTPTGQTGVNQQAVQSAQQQAAAMSGSASAGLGGGISGGDMILPFDRNHEIHGSARTGA